MRDRCLAHGNTPFSFCSPLEDRGHLEANPMLHLCQLEPRGLSHEQCPIKQCLGTTERLDKTGQLHWSLANASGHPFGHRRKTSESEHWAHGAAPATSRNVDQAAAAFPPSPPQLPGSSIYKGCPMLLARGGGGGRPSATPALSYCQQERASAGSFVLRRKSMKPSARQKCAQAQRRQFKGKQQKNGIEDV